jgi:hypothetical protein
MVFDDIGEYLESNGIGKLAVDIIIGTNKKDIDNLVVIIPTGGYPQMQRIKDIKPTFQIYVRDVSFISGYTRINKIFNLLDKGNKQLIVSPRGRDMLIKAMQPPMSLGKDESNRDEFVFNIRVITKRDYDDWEED